MIISMHGCDIMSGIDGGRYSQGMPVSLPRCLSTIWTCSEPSPLERAHGAAYSKGRYPFEEHLPFTHLIKAGSLSFLLSILFILFFLILKPIIQFRKTPDQDLLLIIIKFIHDGCDHLFVESCMMNKRLLALI